MRWMLALWAALLMGLHWPGKVGVETYREGFVLWGASEFQGVSDQPAPENNDFPACCSAGTAFSCGFCGQNALNRILPDVRARIVAFPGNSTDDWITNPSPNPSDEMNYQDGWNCTVNGDCGFYRSAAVMLGIADCLDEPADPDAALDTVYDDHVTAIDWLLTQSLFKRIIVMKSACIWYPIHSGVLDANATECAQKYWSDTCGDAGDCSKALDTRLGATYDDGRVQFFDEFSLHVNDEQPEWYFGEPSQGNALAARCHINGFGQALQWHLWSKHVFGGKYTNERPVTPAVEITDTTATTIDVSVTGATDPDGDTVSVYTWAAEDLNDLGTIETADRLTQLEANEWLADPGDAAGDDGIPDHFPVALTDGAGTATIHGLATGTDYKVVVVSFDGKVGSDYSVTDVTTP